MRPLDPLTRQSVGVHIGPHDVLAAYETKMKCLTIMHKWSRSHWNGQPESEDNNLNSLGEAVSTRLVNNDSQEPESSH